MPCFLEGPRTVATILCAPYHALRYYIPLTEAIKITWKLNHAQYRHLPVFFDNMGRGIYTVITGLLGTAGVVTLWYGFTQMFFAGLVDPELGLSGTIMISFLMLIMSVVLFGLYAAGNETELTAKFEQHVEEVKTEKRETAEMKLALNGESSWQMIKRMVKAWYKKNFPHVEWVD